MEKNIDNMMDTADIMANKSFEPINDLIAEIMNIPEENLNDNMIDVISGMINGAFTPSVRNDFMNEVLENMREENYSRASAKQHVQDFKDSLQDLFQSIKASDAKLQLLNVAFKPICEIFDEALERYNLYDFVLPIKLDEGAQVPTYAHESDAAADLYAADDMTIPAHSISNMVRTGVHIALPEGWAAIIIPRSSIGAKTGLRLSNSQGLIDTQYRGPLGVIYDNISDSDYEIKKGDRIAQLYMMPVHRFKAQIVDTLEETDRGQGGFGSTGK